MIIGFCLFLQLLRVLLLFDPTAAKLFPDLILLFFFLNALSSNQIPSLINIVELVHCPEASLSGVEPLMQKIHSEIRVVDAEVLAAVRQHSNSGTKAKEDLAAATHAVEVRQHWQLKIVILLPVSVTLLASMNNALNISCATWVLLQELMYKVREIKTKAEQSETMVQEICRDIKKLDCAKKHITTTITALHRLT
ncbi:hypothetical protein L1987_56674 [Smallanthus sonchifolius]|uniref:Uncharacterized protein n=1 Tax=Smallanthus sonchifolius TaxID=185202 RepID=A0ACB9EEH2_9ASTR|nr:hypothetical protein L1987_56674 [Smallanthus sonchifolius]